MHEPDLEVSRWFPSGVPAGAELVCTIQVRCPSACDLRGAEVSVVAPDGLVASSEIIHYEQGINNSGEVALKAPLAVGKHEWSVLFRPSPQEDEPAVHAESSLLLPFSTRSHGSSLAIWDVPSPVIMGESFSIKVGAKCAEGCDLQGMKVEIYDESGDRLTTAKFGEALWPGSDALYWAEVELVAPPRQGVASWSVGLPTPDLELPHEPTSSKFSFATTRPPEHELTVHVVEEGSVAAPVPNAEVRLGAYQTSTDESGRASMAVAEGNYQFLVWKVGYETHHPKAIEVSGDLALKVEATVLPDNSSWEDD